VLSGDRLLSTSLFERLLELYGDAVKLTLLEQHRMHPEIMTFPSREMYAGELRAHPAVADRKLELESVDAPPVLFVDTAGRGWSEAREADSDSYVNPGEASLLVARVNELTGAGVTPEAIGVIAPYSAQVMHLREQLGARGVEVATVDGFQGREKDVILLSLVRSNDEGQIGFLSDLRRMNVAITRARRHLFVCGDAGTLSAHPFYDRFIEYARGVGGYRSVWEWPGAAEL
jgi:ATP-dependent RNA/DNA helicase IGHMBP2